MRVKVTVLMLMAACGSNDPGSPDDAAAMVDAGPDAAAIAPQAHVIASGLDRPSSIALAGGTLYIGTDDGIVTIPVDGATDGSSNGGLVVDGDALFWAGGAGVYTAPRTGGEPIRLYEAQALHVTQGLALAPGAIYFGDYAPDDSVASILRMDRAGAGVEPFATYPGRDIMDLEVDDDRAYWVTSGADFGRLVREPLDGSPGAIVEVSNPSSVALDGDHLYYTEQTADEEQVAVEEILRAPRDGSAAPTTIARSRRVGSIFSSAYELVVRGGHVYWLDWEQSLQRAPADGGDADLIEVGLAPGGFVVDDVAVYWTSPYTGEVLRTDLADL